MSVIEQLLQELEAEAKTTRRVLERVPADRLAWKPHEKALTLGQLAFHVAIVPGGIAEASQESLRPVPKFEFPSATSTAQLTELLDESLAKARTVLGRMDDRDLVRTWRLMDGAREAWAAPVGGMLRSLMLNHWYHHRGQLCAYLRQLGIAVPSIYGPSADENPFAMPSIAAVA